MIYEYGVNAFQICDTTSKLENTIWASNPALLHQFSDPFEHLACVQVMILYIQRPLDMTQNFKKTEPCICLF